MTIKTWEEVIDFWFSEEIVPIHFAEDKDLDEKIKNEFSDTWKAASEGLLVDWRDNIRGRLAEIIVLDQFSRNLWRNDIKSYSQDKMAIALAQEAVKKKEYKELSKEEKKFILLPFMHSESLKMHDWADKYYKEIGDEELMRFEKMHREVLEEFGRYPYKNDVLGRKSTDKELKALEDNKDGFYS
ncbi:MAG: DUF924 family protein [Senegalia sp. (in: firmicutes)]|uniref:DUF924 family protein n=1 Tax=Senegalia sp. (in: firmicutes) TaxID=1924098 RepID=UPI003F98724B